MSSTDGEGREIFSHPDRWEHCPIGTKAHAISGGYWIKTERGWKWHNGDTFPRPGADAFRLELPKDEAS